MKALKLIRVAVAATVLTLLTLFFLGVAEGLGFLAKIQIGPAIVGCSVVTLVVWGLITLLFGRVFCSFACPLGILQDLLGCVARLFRRPAFAFRPGHPFVRVMAFCAFLFAGSSVAALLDPYSTYGRFVAQLLQPAADVLKNLLADKLGTDGAIVLFKQEVFVRSVSGLVLAASSLVLLTLLVAWKGRLVCNTICPIGAALGGLSLKPVFGIRLDAVKCVECGACTRVCKAGCLDGRQGVVDQSRCVRCFNCLGACAKGAISYGRPLKSLTPPKADASGVGRRAVLVGFGASAASVCLEATSDRLCHRAVTPPGTLPQLRANCTACGLCVAKCPHQVLTPAGFTDYGPFGFMLPKRDFTRGFCPPDCSVCAKVCPTGAIVDIAGVDLQKFPHTTAAWDEKTCLLCTEKLSCGLCTRRCPHGALLQEDGRIVVDTDKCTGCGACAHYCPSGAIALQDYIKPTGT